MKTLKLFLITCFIITMSSCSPDDSNGKTAVFAVPVVKSLQSIRNGVKVTTARQTHSDGKIYVAQSYLFYIAQEEGVHIFNNQNPAQPQNIAFLNIEGVHDISVKGNYLYADNYVDLLVFDISNIHQITLVKTVENAFNFYAAYPENAEFYDYTVNVNEGEIITKFKKEIRRRPKGQGIIWANNAFAAFESASGNIGTGGSYARFQINNNALYAVETHQLNVYNITNPLNTHFDKAIYLNEWINGGQFETLFKQKNYLFVGATNGMFIVNATDEFNPYFVSGFSHATACDPVVVHENIAYITVRGGATCGAIEDQVNVINIENISNPTLISKYLLSNPYGLGIRNNALYICCGSGGLKVFNATNSASLSLQNTYSHDVTDVIPLDTHLIAVGKNKIYQFNYGPNYSLTPISVLSL